MTFSSSPSTPAPLSLSSHHLLPSFLSKARGGIAALLTRASEGGILPETLTLRTPTSRLARHTSIGKQGVTHHAVAVALLHRAFPTAIEVATGVEVTASVVKG